MNILVLTKYSYEGPSSRYRFYNYKTCFKKYGIKLTIKPFFNSEYFLAKNKIKKIWVTLKFYFLRLFNVLNILIFKNRYELLLIEYELFPYFPATFEWLLKKRGIKYIVDYDDAAFHKYDMHYNKFARPFLKFFLQNKIAKVMQYAETVMVCNDYLEEYAINYNTNIVRLPTVVLLENYKEVMNDFKNNDENFVIGWIGSRTTSVYILEILPAIEKFVKKYNNIAFNLVGFDANLLSDEELEKYCIKVIPWSEEHEINHILSFNVGIMPLHNDPWSRGKCGFKLIQYMSCKKPVIASPVGVNCTIVEEGKNGFLVEHLEEWFEAFEKLYLDEVLREKMANNNFEKIEREFSYDKNCTYYVKLIETITRSEND